MAGDLTKHLNRTNSSSSSSTEPVSMAAAADVLLARMQQAGPGVPPSPRSMHQDRQEDNSVVMQLLHTPFPPLQLPPPLPGGHSPA
jgi:hypothetical protein